MDKQPERPETDRVITDLARGKAERLLLGKNPYASMLAITLFVLIFIVVFGTIFFFAQR
jgi:hypothetical protein